MMKSPYKLSDNLNNYLKITEDKLLAEKLKIFFQMPENEYMWKLSTIRQTVTKELKDTEMVSLKITVPDPSDVLKNTNHWNQLMNIKNSSLVEKYEIFNDLINWINITLLKTGASNVELGRIFFSKHKSNSKIDLHTDEGKYFDYYDRFHFVIDQADYKNIFFIRDEPIKLLTGGLYWVNNHVPHYLENRSNIDRINLIIDARLT